MGRSRAVRRLLACVALLGLAAIAACGGSTASASGPSGRAGAAPAKGCTGPATATAELAVEPVTTNPPQALPVTYTDITGSTVTITDTSRILALDNYGTLATTVYALGLGDRLIGRDVSTGVPELMHLPLVTHNGHQLNGEAILDLRPSVVLTDYSIGPLEVQLQLRDSGVPVVIMSDQRSRAEIGPQIQAVADALGISETGAQLAARVERDIQAAEQRVTDLAPADSADRLRMVFLYIRGSAGVYYWFGKGSGADDLIESLGGIDVAAAAGLEGMRPLNAEGLARAEPDLFLVMTEGLESVGGVSGLLDIPGIAETGAGLSSCVVDMSDSQILGFGPQFPAVLQALAEAIYQRAVRR